jgi:hypothetical protein
MTESSLMLVSKPAREQAQAHAHGQAHAQAQAHGQAQKNLL